MFIFSLHVSGDCVPIIRRNNCNYATLGICHSVWMTVWCAGWNLHTRQSSIENNKYQLSHRYSYFSWRWARSHPKHVAKINKQLRNIVHQVGFIYKLRFSVCFWLPSAVVLGYWHEACCRKTTILSIVCVTFSFG